MQRNQWNRIGHSVESTPVCKSSSRREW